MKPTRTYPNPDNTDPATRDTVDVGEAPVTVDGDDRGHKLGETEGAEQSHRGTLHEEETVRPSDEDERLRDDRNLEVDDRVQDTVVVVVRLDSLVLEVNTELVVEERGLDADGNKSDPVRKVTH